VNRLSVATVQVIQVCDANANPAFVQLQVVFAHQIIFAVLRSLIVVIGNRPLGYLVCEQRRTRGCNDDGYCRYEGSPLDRCQ